MRVWASLGVMLGVVTGAQAAPLGPPVDLDAPVDIDMNGALTRFEGWTVGLGAPNAGAFTFGGQRLPGGVAIGGVASSPTASFSVFTGSPTRAEAVRQEPYRAAINGALDADVAWTQILELPTRASWTQGQSGVAVRGGYDDPEQDAGMHLRWSSQIATEQRFYPTPTPFFVGVRGGVNYLAATGVGDVPAAFPSLGDGQIRADVHALAMVGLGGGRVLDVGPSSRLAKLEDFLIERGTLAERLSDRVAHKVLATWYALRNDITRVRLLHHTERILLESGAIDGPLDLEDAYVVLATVNNLAFATRPTGWQVGAWADGRVRAVDVEVGGDPDVTVALLVEGSYGHLIDADRMVLVDVVSYLDPGVTDGAGISWTQAGVAFDHYVFGRYRDALGAFRVAAVVDVAGGFGTEDAVSHTLFGLMMPAVQRQLIADEVYGGLTVSVGWRHALSRGSSFGIGATGRLDGSTLLAYPQVSLGFDAGFQWGVAQGRFSAATIGR